jgi:hypothetical protein
MRGERDTAAVREQLARLLSHPLLKSSRRCRGFLQFVVDETLEGRGDALKERTVGVAVFGRSVEYDTSLDHIVRTAATDLRRRLALYYQEPDRMGELRINLPQGTYTPTFEPPTAGAPVVPAPPPSAEFRLLRTIPLFQTRWRWGFYVLAGLLAFAAIGIVAARMTPRRLTAIDTFWAPFLDSPDPVLLCVGTFQVPETILQEADQRPSQFTRYVRQAMPALIASGDSDTAARVAGLLSAKGKKIRIRTQSSSTLADLREGPAVLIGGLNNAWSLRLSDQLRYNLAWEAEKNRLRIRDRDNPSRDAWKAACSREGNGEPLNEDFALISRVWDSTTGHPVLIAGGLTMSGTIAAGEFLSDPKRLEEFAASAPKGWDRRNLQIVISTQLIGGDSGPPKVQAVESW